MLITVKEPIMKTGFFPNKVFSCIVEWLTTSQPMIPVTATLWLLVHGNVNSRRASRASGIRSRLVTVSKSAWPASSGAAVLAASCLSESPDPGVVDRTMEIFRAQNN